MPFAIRKDDRGNLCRLLDTHPGLSGIFLPPGHPDHALNQLRARFLLAGRPIDAALNVIVPGVALSLAPLAITIATILITRPTALRPHFPWIDASTCIAVVGLYATLAAAIWSAVRLVRYRGSGRFHRDLAGVGRCVACGYALRDLEHDAHDRCVTCPECGAGWRCPAA